jgi:RND family efflux transporter MFP subunit
VIKKIIFVLVILSVAVLSFNKLRSEKNKVENAPTPLNLSYSIKTTKVKKDRVDEKYPFLAQVQSSKEIKLATKLSGVIQKVYVSESQIVKKGELLVKIDDRALQTQLKTLMDTLKVQQKDVDYYESVKNRNKKLYEADAISKERYDASVLLVLNKKAIVDSTKQKIKSIKSDLTYLELRAPFDGVISSIFLHEGDLATTGKPILSLNSFAKKMQFAFAGEQNSIKVKDRVFKDDKEIGFISKIYPNAKNSLYIAEIELSTHVKAKSNSFISIDVVTRSISGCSLPVNAFLHVKDGVFVLAYKDSKFSKKRVKILIEDDQKAIIEPCIEEPVALGSESKLSILPAYKNITVVSK